MNAQKVPPARLARVVEYARHLVGRVHQRSVPPAAAMMDMILWAWRVQGISAAAELKIADALADGPLTADELARRVDADPDALARLMRALISEGIFTRRRDGRFAINALGATLRTDAPLFDNVDVLQWHGPKEEFVAYAEQSGDARLLDRCRKAAAKIAA